MVLPPMVEWARVATAFAEHRNSTHVDNDDVMQVTDFFLIILNFLRFDSNLLFFQAARILLPGMDCPVRPMENPPLSLSTSMSAMLDELEYVNHVKKEMALHMLQTGRRDLVPHALQMLPNTDKVNTTNNAGLTPLQMAALRGDTNVVSLSVAGFTIREINFFGQKTSSHYYIP
jgi:ankyrin repeat protein